jgi:hypothetical protein
MTIVAYLFFGRDPDPDPDKKKTGSGSGKNDLDPPHCSVNKTLRLDLQYSLKPFGLHKT